jgi:predicted dienelactone hydrolase
MGEVGAVPDLRDPRVRSIVLMAPNAAPFTDDALATVAITVLVYAARHDEPACLQDHAERLARALARTECVLVQGARHFSFAASFPAALKIVTGEGGRDPDGFDRDALGVVLTREIVGSFDGGLRPGGEALSKDAQPPSCRPHESHPGR